MVSDEWIAQGCAEVARLVGQGKSGPAAELLAWIERRALEGSGDLYRRWRMRDAERRRRLKGCEVRGCPNQRAKGHLRWCLGCRAKMRRDAEGKR